MSALMTTTAPEQKKVIAMLGEEGLREVLFRYREIDDDENFCT